jgi:UDP-3-O-[3-hydroxymyristoyl] glucosamine N-acyltransferase
MAALKKQWCLADIVERLGGELRGDARTAIDKVASLTSAGPGDIAFLVSPKYRQQLATTQASAVILAPAMADSTALPRIVDANPHAYYARVVGLLNPPAHPAAGIDPGAVVRSATPASVHVGANASVGVNVQLGEGVVIYPGCVLGDNVVIGDGSVLYPNVVVYADCRIGNRAIIHSGAVIGSDGFGFAKDGCEWVKIPQVGRVVIGDDVEIGANTAIDRGALDDTVVGNCVKLDNQIHIAHNVKIGDYTAMAACVGIAGSTTIGRRCTFGGAAMISGHLEIADDVHVSGGTLIAKNVSKPGVYTSVYPVETHDRWLKNASQLRHLDSLSKRLRELEKLVAGLSEGRSDEKTNS